MIENGVKEETEISYYRNRLVKRSIIGVAIIWIAYFIIKNLFFPKIVTDVALEQFNNTAESFYNMQIINLFQNSGIVIPIILTLIVAARVMQLIIKNQN